MESYVVQAHGCINDDVIVVPNNVNLIMFCYNKTLTMKCAFERFSWKFAQSEYSTLSQLITGLKKYSSTRNHFCLYRPGDTIRELEIYPDDDNEFRDGIYHIPIVFNEMDDDNDLDLRSNTMTAKVLNKVARANNYVNISSNHYLFSKTRSDKGYLLSNLISDIKSSHTAGKNITLVLFQCKSLCDDAKASIPDKLSTGIKLRNYREFDRSIGTVSGVSSGAGAGAGAGSGSGASSGVKLWDPKLSSDEFVLGWTNRLTPKDKNLLRKGSYKSKPMKTSRDKYNKRNRSIKRYQIMYNHKSIPELRTECNKQGITCINADGSFMTKTRMVTNLAKNYYNHER